MSDNGYPPVRRSVIVNCDPAAAFAAFTDEAGDWWPLPGHSMHGDEAAGLTMDARVGGEIVETAADGTRTLWGTFLRVERPGLLVFSWHPGWDAERATEVEVRFSPDPGGTLVELEHRGWEHHPRKGAAREQYDGKTGWATVLGEFSALVAAARPSRP